MKILTATEFQSMEDDLAELFISAAAAYARNMGIENLNIGALRQMHTSLLSVAGETLMFGADIWPESARSSDDDWTPMSGEKIVPFVIPFDRQRGREPLKAILADITEGLRRPAIAV